MQDGIEFRLVTRNNFNLCKKDVIMMKCRICAKEMTSLRVKFGDGSDNKIGQTYIDVEGAICESCSKSEWGDGERRNL
jgi:hypothetical protein